jgi:hypothetical protein
MTTLGEWGGTLIDHWRELDAPWLKSYYIGFGEPFCFACGWLAPVQDGTPGSWDLAVGGHFLIPTVLVEGDAAMPLCALCRNEPRPEFASVKEGHQWVEQHLDTPSWFQMYTDNAMKDATPEGRAALENVVAQMMGAGL